MDMIEELVTTISQKINNTLQIQFGDLNIDLQRPWARLTMAEAIDIPAIKSSNLSVNSGFDSFDFERGDISFG